MSDAIDETPRIGEIVSKKAEVLLSTAQKIVEGSQAVHSDFAKLMIKYSIGAIPVYLALLQFSKFTQASSPEMLMMPIYLFLFSNIMFIFSYSPKTIEFEFELMEAIETAIKKAEKRRKRLNFVGLVFYLMGIVLASLLMVGILK